jgi:outer membrane protein assembly factor BamB
MQDSQCFPKSLCVLVFLLLFAGIVSAQNWPMVNLNRERTSWAAEETVLQPPLEKADEYHPKTGGYTVDGITFLDGVIALALEFDPNVLEMVDAGSMDTLWTFKVPGSVASMLHVCAQNDSMVFAGGQYGLGLHALNRETGEQKWFKPIGSLFSRNLILDGEFAYISGDSLYCLRISDGSTVWAVYRSFQGTPAVDDLYVYAVGRHSISIHDKTDGSLVWQRTHSINAFGSIAVDTDCFYTISGDTVYAFNRNVRDVKWFYHNPGDQTVYGNESNLAITDNVLCYSVQADITGNGKVVALNKADGSLNWERTFSGLTYYAPAIANGIVYVVAWGEHSVNGFDLATGNRVFFDDSELYYYGQPVIADHRLYVSSGGSMCVYSNTTSVDSDIGDQTPESPTLIQNYPNPFNSTTTIHFDLPCSENVTVKIFDNGGKEIMTLLRKHLQAGRHRVKFDSRDLPSGVYICRLNAGNTVRAMKMLLMK